MRFLEMIRNQWYAVLASNEVKKKPIGVTRMGEKLVFWRNQAGNLSCLKDKCAHRFAALSIAKICNDHIQCPFHGLEYDITGKCKLIPANGKNTPIPERFFVNYYPTFEKHGMIWIFWGDKLDTMPEVQFFDDIDTTFSTSLIKDHWNTHYSRAMENQLDVAHLPFVHKTTIGAGNKTLVDGPVVQWNNETKFSIYVYNRKDNGQKPKTLDEITVDYDKDFKVELIMPNMWENYISPKFRIVVFFVPVDNENTILYLMLFQKMVTIPLLKFLFEKLAMAFNKIVLHQDRRVVITQHPKHSELNGGELLFQADRPIVEYRQKRQKLISL
jgi:phenylpropionate dioxygenase-like ring-hydroxylating dioxygenase large terminal subunit